MEKEYIISLKEDLLTDTASAARVFPLARMQYEKLDSLTILVKLAAQGKPYNINRLYYLNFRFSFGIILLSQNERTISQIKSTGSI